MADFLGVLKKESRPRIQSLRDDMKLRKDPDYFWPSGTQIYCGRQGSGKTISAVRHVGRLRNRYRKCILVSNLFVSGAKQLTFRNENELKSLVEEMQSSRDRLADYYIYIQSMEELALALVHVNNDKYGVIYLIDEIHTYFNALESANIPMFVFTEISQQRKQRKLIIGTSQLFMRLAKPFREQCDSLIVCNTIGGIFTTQKAYDGMELEQDYDGSLIGSVKKRGWFFHTRKIRDSYDTFQKVVSGAEQYENAQRVDINLKSRKNKITLKK